AALLKHRHLDSEHLSNAARHDLSLERIQTLRESLGQRGERNRFRDSDDRRSRVRAERAKAMRSRARVASHTAATVATGIRERMPGRLDSPSFLLQHGIIHDALDGPLAVRFA